MAEARRIERLRVVVTGLIGSIPFGGLTAHYLQYVLGLHALGHDVLYLEDTGWYYDPMTRQWVDRSTGQPRDKPIRPVAVLEPLMARHGLGDRWTYVDVEGNAHGVTGSRLTEFLRTADLFLHVTGSGFLREEYQSIPHRAFVDTDPGFVQMRAASGSQKDVDHLERHTAYFTFGCNVGDETCDIPTLGLPWRPTVQPVFLPLWVSASRPSPETAVLTTVVKWQPYHGSQYRGTAYGMKDLEFRKFWRVPQLAGVPLEMAMAGAPPVDEIELEQAGWRLRDATGVSASLDAYRDYVLGSLGEWSVAKNGYVASRSGWFSERSANYMASGRPVILQSTGFERWLPTGAGILSFRTVEEAVDAIDEVRSRYDHHARAAREIASEFFDSGRVLTRMLDELVLTHA
jgi:hypothetical protein